jgi:DNA polymerase V
MAVFAFVFFMLIIRSMKKEAKKYRVIIAEGVFSGVAALVGSVQAGFPSPAEEYIQEPLDLNRYCVKNPPATFFVRAAGDSMTGAGIHCGDLLVVDRSIRARDNDVVIAVVDGEFTLKRLTFRQGRPVLVPENPAFRPIEISEATEFEVWGKVVKVIHELE